MKEGKKGPVRRTRSLTSDVVEDVPRFGQFSFQLSDAGVEKQLHSVDLLLHQAAAA